jgi:hypothetical protein
MKKTFAFFSLFLIIGLVTFSFTETPKKEFTQDGLENKIQRHSKKTQRQNHCH